MTVRDERPADQPAVARLLEEAFGGTDEARLVERLREDGDDAIALVAEDESGIGGYILFSPLQAPFRALALAPLAVTPGIQGRGIGSCLVQAGLDRAKAEGWDVVFVLGDPDYYRRFGFTIEAAAAFESPYAGPHFMAARLAARDLARAALVYPPAFANL